MESHHKYDVESKGPPLSSSLASSMSPTPPSSGPASLGIPVKRLLREIAATIDCVLVGCWMSFAFILGYSEETADQSHSEPTSKIYKVLQLNAAQHHGDTEEWWKQFQTKLTSFGDADLTTQIQAVYNKWNNSRLRERTLQTSSSESSFEKVSPALQSNVSFLSGFASDYSHHEERDDNIAPDRPEISMEINVVAEALDRVSNNPATAEITKWLRDGVPRIIRLERELKSQKALRGIFENESYSRKTELEERQKLIDQLRQTNENLKLENEELQRAKKDEQLNEFDYVTRKEAQDIKQEEHVQNEKQRSGADGVTPAVTADDFARLKRDNASLKKQINEIVKVNHSWDEHYKKMKGQLEKQIIDLRKEDDTLLSVRNENEQLKTRLAGIQQEMDNNQKENDTLLLQAKNRIERTEKDKAEKQKDLDVVRQKFDKVQGYARTLTNQRKDAEAEISRLNEALAQKMNIGPSANYSQTRSTSELQTSKHNTSPLPTPQAQQSIPSGIESLLNYSLEIPQKRMESMTEPELRDELELLRQQTEVFRSDFNHEREDRQRVMGELDETKKELKKHQLKLKGYRMPHTTPKARQVLEDERYAKHLQLQEEAAPQMTQPRYPYQAKSQFYVPPPQQRPAPRNYYSGEVTKAMQMPPKQMIPHGPGYYYRPSCNYAANDLVIDGADAVNPDQGIETDDTDGDLETDGNCTENGPKSEGTCDNMTCPRCKRSFIQDGEFHVHIVRMFLEAYNLTVTFANNVDLFYVRWVIREIRYREVGISNTDERF